MKLKIKLTFENGVYELQSCGLIEIIKMTSDFSKIRQETNQLLIAFHSITSQSHEKESQVNKVDSITKK